MRAIFEEAWNQERYDSLEGRLGSEVRFHFHGQTFLTGLDHLPGLVGMWRTAFPDLAFEIHEVVAEDDLVAVRLTFAGTHLGPWEGVAPSGARVSVSEMMFFRFEGDRLVEMWEVFDQQGLLHQIAGGTS